MYRSPHAPIKIFMCYNSITYFFRHDGFSAPCDSIREYSDCINKLKINDSDAIRYLKAIWLHLRREIKRIMAVIDIKTLTTNKQMRYRDILNYWRRSPTISL